MILMTSSEMHALYQKEYPDDKVGLSSFRKLRPYHVQFMKSSNQDVCKCTYHENLELLFDSLKKNQSVPTLNIEEMMMKSLCSFDNLKCINRQCSKYSGDELNAIFEGVQGDQQIVYHQWSVVHGRVEKSAHIRHQSRSHSVSQGENETICTPCIQHLTPT